MYSNHEFVPFPGEDYGVMLRPVLARSFLVLASAGEQGATAKEIERQCDGSASTVISKLRASGALILTIPAPFVMYRGTSLSQGGTRYRYIGWDPEAPNRYRISKKKKEAS